MRHKNTAWLKEDEYRFLSKQKDDKIKIGEITAIYFGTPYENLSNREPIIKKSETIKDFMKNKEKIKRIAISKSIDCWDVKVENNKVEKDSKL